MILPSQASIIKTCRHQTFIAPGDVRASLEEEGDTAREPTFQEVIGKTLPVEWTNVQCIIVLEFYAGEA